MMDTSTNAEHNNVAFPTEKTLTALRERIAGMNGPDSFAPARQWQSEAWYAEAHCSRGRLLEKAGIGMLHLIRGVVEGAPAQISMLQAMAYPAHPRIPGLIVMASTSRLDGQDPIMMLYADLIRQGGRWYQAQQEAFAAALKGVCDRHGANLDEYQLYLRGRDMLGGCAAECGMLYFFEDKDCVILEDLVQGCLAAYSGILASAALSAPSPEDRQAMQEARRRMVDWILSQDYGVKVARENAIPLEFMETYGFPPLQE
jgi:hypothetical protein